MNNAKEQGFILFLVIGLALFLMHTEIHPKSCQVVKQPKKLISIFGMDIYLPQDLIKYSYDSIKQESCVANYKFQVGVKFLLYLLSIGSVIYGFSKLI